MEVGAGDGEIDCLVITGHHQRVEHIVLRSINDFIRCQQRGVVNNFLVLLRGYPVLLLLLLVNVDQVEAVHSVANCGNTIRKRVERLSHVTDQFASLGEGHAERSAAGLLLVLLLALPAYPGHGLGGEGHCVDPDDQAGDEAGVEVAVISAGEGLWALELVLQELVHQVEFVIPLEGAGPVWCRAGEDGGDDTC